MQFVRDPNGSDATKAATAYGRSLARACLITGRTSDPEGFIDARKTTSEPDTPVVLSAAAVKEMARMLGWASPEDVEQLTTQIEANNERIKELEGIDERVSTLHRSLESFAAEIQDLNPPEEVAA